MIDVLITLITEVRIFIIGFIKVKNVNDDLYISLFNGTLILRPVNGEIKEVFNNGTWNFEVYSNKCESKIDEIEVHIPRFNVYSLDSLCEGIDGDDFALCGKYYEYDVSYDSFKERVTYYRTIHSIGTDNDNDELKDNNNIFDILLNFFAKYKLYLIMILLIVIVMIVIITIVHRSKKRGVLE